MITVEFEVSEFEDVLLALERADNHSTSDRFRKLFEKLTLDDKEYEEHSGERVR